MDISKKKIYFYYDPEISLFLYVSTKEDLDKKYLNLKKVILEEWYYPTGLFIVQNEYLFRSEDGEILFSTVENINSNLSPSGTFIGKQKKENLKKLRLLGNRILNVHAKKYKKNSYEERKEFLRNKVSLGSLKSGGKLLKNKNLKKEIDEISFFKDLLKYINFELSSIYFLKTIINENKQLEKINFKYDKLSKIYINYYSNIYFIQRNIYFSKIKKEFKNDKIYYKNKDLSIFDNNYMFKYKFVSYIFLLSYQLFYKIIKKYILPKNIIEISTNPVYFECYYYFNKYLKIKNNVKHFDVLTSNLNFNNDSIEVWNKYLNILKKNTKTNKNIKFKHSDVNWSIPIKKYDMMILNLYISPPNACKTMLNEFHLNLSNFYKQLDFLKYIKKGGSCLFYIHSILSNEAFNIYLEVCKNFKNIELSISHDFFKFKTVSGLWLWCTNKGEYKVNEKEEFNKIKSWNEKYYYEKANYLENFYNYINKGNYDLAKIRMRQIVYAYDWAKKYQFEILPIWEPHLKSIINKNILSLFDSKSTYELFTFQNKKTNKKSAIKPLNIDLYLQEYNSQIDNIQSYLESQKDKDLNNEYQDNSFLSPIANNEGNLPYYLFTHFNILNISYSWVKLFEILKSNPKLINTNNKNNNILKTFHFCELPGNFVSALFYYLQIFDKNKKWNWKAQSLIDNKLDTDIYGYYKKFFSNFDQGILKNGDLFKKENVKYYLKTYKNSLNFITFDCFDWNNDLKIISLKDKLKVYKILIDNILIEKGSFVTRFMIKDFKNFNKYLIDFIKEMCCQFDEVKIYNSIWSYQNYEFFLIGISKNNKKMNKRSAFESILNNYIENTFNKLLELYKKDVDNYLFLRNNLRNIDKNDEKKIMDILIKRNKEWCSEYKINSKNIKYIF